MRKFLGGCILGLLAISMLIGFSIMEHGVRNGLLGMFGTVIFGIIIGIWLFVGTTIFAGFDIWNH